MVKVVGAGRFNVLLNICGLMLLVHVINILLNYRLVQFGLLPRDIQQWWGVFTAPFLHGSLPHLLNNLVGMLIFGALCSLRSRRFFIEISVFIVVFSGVAVWLFGRSSLHIGASGWVFGLWSACIAIAWIDRKLFNILVAIFVIFFYGGMVYGVLPLDPRVSFEFHLAGAIGGVIAVLTFSRKRLRRL